MDLRVTTYDRLRSPVCVLTSQNNLVAQMLLRMQSSNMKLAPYRFLRRQGRESGITEARRQPSRAQTRCNTRKGTGDCSSKFPSPAQKLRVTPRKGQGIAPQSSPPLPKLGVTPRKGQGIAPQSSPPLPKLGVTPRKGQGSDGNHRVLNW